MGTVGFGTTVAIGVATGAVSGAAGGATYGWLEGNLSRRSSKTITQNTLSGGLNGFVSGGLTGGLGSTLTGSTAGLSNPLLRYGADTASETVVDTLVDSATGGDVTPGSIATNLAFNAVTEGVSARVAKADVAKNKPKAGNASKTPEIEISFKKNPKHDANEFSRQLQNQQNGMNELTVEDYIKNRGDYLANGRSSAGDAAQQAARDIALENKVGEILSSGTVNSLEEAEVQAKKWLITQDAVHNPDQIAGGFANKIAGVGDLGINRSIGSQWSSRIGAVDEVVDEIVRTTPYNDLQKTNLNVKLLP